MDSPGENTGGDVPMRGWNPGVLRRRQALRREDAARGTARWGHLVAESAPVSPAALTRRPGGWKLRASGSPGAFPGDSAVNPWVRKVPSSFLPGKAHGQRSLAGYSPGLTESDTTVPLNDSKSPKGQSTNIKQSPGQVPAYSLR